MSARLLLRVGILLALTLALAPAVAQAQATRTWVSGVGDDVNPCSRTAPCKTFAGAITKTAAHGEINALDPGGYGSVTITKPITIDGAGTNASILHSLSPGVVVNAGINDAVVLRNLDINGAAPAADPCVPNNTTGVRILGGRAVRIENVAMERSTNNGIAVTNSTGNVAVYAKNVSIGDVCPGEAIKLAPTGAGTATLQLEDSNITHSSTGLLVGSGGRAFVRGSTFYDDLVGLKITGTGEIDDQGGNVFAANGEDGTPTRSVVPPAGPTGPSGVAGPPGAAAPAPAPTTVTVTTPAPTPPAPIATCQMPKLTGLTLRTAKAKLARAGCRTPTVLKKKGARAKRGKVTAQSQRAATTLTRTTQLTVTVGS